MHRVQKRLNFFRRNQYLVFVGIWLLLALGYLTASGTSQIFGYLYFLLAFSYLYLHFSTRQTNREFIAWNESQITVGEHLKKPKEYPIAEVDSLTVTHSHFMLKSGAANGVFLDLKGYTDEDIQLLKSELSIQNGQLSNIQIR